MELPFQRQIETSDLDRQLTFMSNLYLPSRSLSALKAGIDSRDKDGIQELLVI